MAETLATIDDDHGGIEAYLLGPAALTPQVLDTLRGLLIEP